MLQDYVKTTITKPQAIPFNLGKGIHVQRVLPTDTIQLLVAQKPVEINHGLSINSTKLPKGPVSLNSV